MDESMGVDMMVADLLVMARMLEGAALLGRVLPIPGAAGFPAAAVVLRDMAGDRDRVEAMFKKVERAVDFFLAAVKFLRDLGHHAAADYFTTSGHVPAE